MVLISYDLWLLDGWLPNITLSISVDSDTNNVNGINDVASTDLCGEDTNDLGKFSVKSVIAHSSSSLTLSFKANIDPEENEMIYGVRNIQILLGQDASITPSTAFCLNYPNPAAFGTAINCPCDSNEFDNSGSC